ncbi:MAG: sensor histidine kinase [Pseudomonadota bacterium]
MDNCKQLAQLLREKRSELMSTWRAATRQLPSAKDLDRVTLTDHIPLLLEQLAEILDAGIGPNEMESYLQGSPLDHGLQRLQNGFEVEELVAEYNILRRCIYELAEEYELPLLGRSFRVFNRVLDETITAAVRTFALQQALEIRHRREEYLAFVAHDLRTPLNAISLLASMLQVNMAGQSDGKTQQYVKTLQRNVGYLTRLVAKVLDESANIETESGVKVERRDLDLWPLIESLIYDLHPVAGSGSTHISNQVPEEIMVYADAELLRRVFQNLIANALDFTPHGEIIISAECLSDDAIACEVSDNGAGIPADRLASVFDKFETDKTTSSGGLGLGLTICKAFIEAHGGTITVTSKLGSGTTFRFTLPARKATPQQLM